MTEACADSKEVRGQERGQGSERKERLMQTVLKPLGEVLASISLSNRVQGRSFVMLSAGWAGTVKN